MAHHAFRRAHLVIPLGLAVLASCADTSTTAPRLGREASVAQGVGGVWTVNTLADPGAGGCDDTECTLREAIAAATSGDQIGFAGLQGRILLTSGELLIDKNLSIDGAGGIIVDGVDNTRIVHATSGTVRLAGMTFVDGNQRLGLGGGILVTAANLTLAGMTLLSNEGNGAGGLYVEPTGAVVIENSLFEFNFAFGTGAIENRGTVTLRNTTVRLNDALSDAAQVRNFGMLVVEGSMVGSAFIPGIVNEVGATAIITRSTLSGNVLVGPLSGRGAAIHNLGSMQLRSTTIAENIAPNGIGGVYNAGTLTAANTIIIANNGNPECGGPAPLTSLGFNLTSPVGGCAFTASTDVIVPLEQAFTNLFESSLADNGGPTYTLALEPGGHAEDKGSCAGETTDQRGFTRPVDNPLYANAADGCDIGAYEIQLTASQQVIVVSNAITALTLQKGVSTSLQTKLSSVQAAITAGDTAGACSSLTAFINEVNAQAGKKKISSADAANLIALATALKTSLGCA
jgi:CSLREA domain-containing protein